MNQIHFVSDTLDISRALDTLERNDSKGYIRVIQEFLQHNDNDTIPHYHNGIDYQEARRLAKIQNPSPEALNTIYPVLGSKPPSMDIHKMLSNPKAKYLIETYNLLEVQGLSFHGTCGSDEGGIYEGYYNKNFRFLILRNGIILDFQPRTNGGLAALGKYTMVDGNPFVQYTHQAVEISLPEGKKYQGNHEVQDPTDIQLQSTQTIHHFMQRLYGYGMKNNILSPEATFDQKTRKFIDIDTNIHTDLISITDRETPKQLLAKFPVDTNSIHTSQRIPDFTTAEQEKAWLQVLDNAIKFKELLKEHFGGDQGIKYFKQIKKDYTPKFVENKINKTS